MSGGGASSALTITSGSGRVVLGGDVSNLSGLTINSKASNSTFTGVLSGSATLGMNTAMGYVGSNSANAVLALSGAHTYTGTTTISGGSLSVTGSLSNSTAVTVNAGATYDVAASDTIASLAGAGTVTLNSNTLTVGDSTSTIYSGAMSGAGSLVKQGSGTLTLSSANTYSGGTSILQGLVQLGAGSALGTAAATVASGAALDVNGQSITNALMVSGTGISNGGVIKNSSASQATLGGEITLTADSQWVTSGAIKVTGAVDGPQTLTVTGAGALTLAGAVGQTTALTSVNVSGPVTLEANVTTSGSQTYQGVTTLRSDVVLSTTNSNVTFKGTLDSTNSTARSLTAALGTGTLVVGDGLADTVGAIHALGAIDVTGGLDLNAAIAGATSLQVSGSTNLGADVTTTGTQSYQGASTLSADVTLTTADNAVSFGSTLDGAAKQLRVNAGTGTTSFVGVVYGLGDTVLTSDEINWSDVFAGTGALTLRSATSSRSLILGSTAAPSVSALNVSAAELNNLGDGFTSITLGSTSGTAGIRSEGHLTFKDPVYFVAAGGTALSHDLSSAPSTDASFTFMSPLAWTGGSVNTTGDQSYGEAITLGADSTLTGATIHTQSTLAGASHALTVTGNANIDGAYTDLSALSISGTTDLGANITTTGAQKYNGAVTLNSDVSLQANNGDIEFSAAVDADVAGQHAFNVRVGNLHSVTFKRSVGAQRALASFSTADAPIDTFEVPTGHTILGANVGSVRTLGDQIYNNLTFLTNTVIAKDTDNVAVTVNSEDNRTTDIYPLRLTSSAGALNFVGTVEGGERAKTNMRSLFLNASTDVTFNSQVGFNAASGNGGDILANYTRHYGVYRLDVTAPRVNILANITAYENINIHGDAYIGGHTGSSETRYVFSLDPAVNFFGRIDGYGLVDGTYSLDVRAIGFDPSVASLPADSTSQPVVKFASDVGSQRKLAGVTAQVAVVSMVDLRGSSADINRWDGEAAPRNQGDINVPTEANAGTIFFGGSVTSTGSQSFFGNNFVLSNGGTRGNEFNGSTYDVTVGQGGFKDANGSRARLRFKGTPSGSVIRALQRARVSITSLPSDGATEFVKAREARELTAAQEMDQTLNEAAAKQLPSVKVGDLIEMNCDTDGSGECRIPLPRQISQAN